MCHGQQCIYGGVTAGADVVTRDSAETAVDGLTMADVEMGLSMALKNNKKGHEKRW